MLILFAGLKNAATKLWSSERRRFNRRGRNFCLRVESLENRELLAADLAVSDLVSDGNNLLVEYAVSNENASPFNVGLYTSADGINADDLLQTERVSNPAGYAQGSGHTLTIAPNFVDPSEDYYLVAVIDMDNEVSESNESNNNQDFSGGVFTSGNVVHVHGSNTSDSVSVSGGSTLDIRVNGGLTSFTPYTVSAVHVRTQNGNDQVDASAAGWINVWVFAGRGDDTLTGGDGDDSLYGGDDDDVMIGGAGDDLLYGGLGHDQLGGGSGHDSIYGEQGADMLHGDAGQDHLDGGSDSDVIYGGDDVDAIYAGSGDDFVFATAADSVSLGSGNDTQYVDEDGGGYGSAYGNRPQISQFAAVETGSLWTISGLVSDAEDDPTGWTVTIGGLVDEATTVAYNNRFALSVSIPEGEFGWVSAQVTDTDGNDSRTVWFLIV